MVDQGAAAAWSVESDSEQDTEARGARLGAALQPGDLVTLEGPLGAGKTRFVAGVSRGLDAKARVRSPTFTLVNEYRGRIPLRHVDLYRLDDRQAERLAFELEDGREAFATVVEWGERLPARWLAEALRVRIEVTAPERRTLHAEAGSAGARRLLAAWRTPAAAGTGGGA